MTVMKVNKESFETEVLKAEGMVLVDFLIFVLLLKY